MSRGDAQPVDQSAMPATQGGAGGGLMSSDGLVYARWLVANTWSESLGLGTTLVAGRLAAPVLEPMTASPAAVVVLAGAVLGGALLEGALVGFAQQRVLRARLPMLRSRSWVGATALGAGLAWLLGMLPSTYFALTSSGAGPQGMMDPGPFLTYASACGLGLVTGPVLGAFQALVLRRHVRRAGVWLWANALAWGAAMPLLFAGMELVPWQRGGALTTALAIYAVCAMAGMVAGAVHGVFLLRLLTRPLDCDTVRSRNQV